MRRETNNIWRWWRNRAGRMAPFSTTAILALCIVGTAAASRAPASTTVDEPPATSEKVRDNLVVVLDDSGSMKEILPGDGRSKMDAAKAALLNVLEKAPPGANVGVLVFAAGKTSNAWVYPLGPVDMSRLRTAIAPIRAGGGTPLGFYIKRAADVLLERRDQQSGYGTFRLLLITDGEADDPKLVERFVPDVMGRGITVDVIGVNMKADHTLSRTVHGYRRANDPAALDAALSDVFAELGTRADDDTQNASFDMIRALPDELATTVLTAITTQRNQPIGERRPTATTPQNAPAPPSASGSPSAPASPSAPTSGAPAPTRSTGGRWPWMVSVATVVVVLIAVRAARRAAGGGAR